MSKFVLIFRGGAIATRTASPSEVQAHLEKWRTWLDGLASAGVGQGGQRLQSAGVTVRGRQRSPDSSENIHWSNVGNASRFATQTASAIRARSQELANAGTVCGM